MKHIIFTKIARLIASKRGNTYIDLMIDDFKKLNSVLKKPLRWSWEALQLAWKTRIRVIQEWFWQKFFLTPRRAVKVLVILILVSTTLGVITNFITTQKTISVVEKMILEIDYCESEETEESQKVKELDVIKCYLDVFQELNPHIYLKISEPLQERFNELLSGKIRIGSQDNLNYFLETLEKEPTWVEKIKVLDLSITHGSLSNDINDISKLKILTGLKKLKLSNTILQNIDALSQLPLQDLYLDNTPITNITPLKDITTLKRIFLNDSPISNISPLKGNLSLEEISLSHTPITDVSPLKGLIRLTKLSLDNTPLKDINGLEGLINLEWLSLNNSRVENIKHLNKLNNLLVLNLSHTPIKDISSLVNLEKLSKLYLNDNSCLDDIDISSLKELPKLQILDLNNMPGVTDISVLKDLTKLKLVYLNETIVSAKDMENLENYIEVNNLDLEVVELDTLPPTKDCQIEVVK